MVMFRRQRRMLALELTTKRNAGNHIRKLVALMGLVLSLPVVWIAPAMATTIGPDAFGYTATDAVPFAFEDISLTGRRRLAGADDDFVLADLGFSFNFYGTVYTRAFLGSNGFITFGTDDSAFGNDDLTVLSYLPRLAVLWDDWQFEQAKADAVYYLTLGSPGSRRFVVQWHKVFHYVSSPSSADFEAILYEGSNKILFQYRDVDTGDETAFAAEATVGIGDENGHLNGKVLQWSVDSDVIANGQAIQFTLACNSDGVLDAGEQCDDGNTTPGDGCDRSCRIEECHTCVGAGPASCTPSPDGTACEDDFNAYTDDECSAGSCTHPNANANTPNYCGNGILEVGEQCDDGNEDDGDGCDHFCDYELIPGNAERASVLDNQTCVVEWSVVNPNNALDGRGRINRRQTCQEGDATCDFDADSHGCTFQVVACLNNDDSVLPGCPQLGVASPIRIVSPSVRRDPTNANQIAAALQSVRDPVTGVGGLTVPLSPPQVGFCSAPFSVRVPLHESPRRRKQGIVRIATRAQSSETSPNRLRDVDAVDLVCVP